jgi:hypothetical protein
MTLNKKADFSLNNLLSLMAALLLVGCASIQRPQGGPRDKTPPKLLKATPANKTRNFTAKEIRLDFDEYFKLTNIFQEISISPAQEKVPEFKVRQKSLVIEFQDTLQKNTTYVINFGKAVADVNESNVLKNFTYVFSTGPQIDSLNISGTVFNTQTQEKEKEATVILIPLKQDSIMFGKKRPSIFTATDSSGNFTLSNLHEGDYQIYGLKESGADRIYNNEKELIAFSNQPIRLRKDTANIQLKLFQQTPENFRVVDKRFDADGKMFFTFNKQLPNLNLKIISPTSFDEQKIVDFGTRKDTALVYMRNMDFDSVQVAFLDNNVPLDTVTMRKGRKETFTRNMAFQYNLTNELLRPNTDFTITANYPIQGVDPSRISLAEDSIGITNFTIQKDPVNPKRFSLKYRWVNNRRYDLVIGEGAFTDIYGGTNKRTSRRFQLDKAENYGLLTLKITVPDSAKSYVVEVMNEQKTILHTDVLNKNTTLIYRNYPTGKYLVRVIYDANKNGRWDSGNVKRKLQPENIWLYDKEITLRPNWDAEEPIIIPKEPATP